MICERSRASQSIGLVGINDVIIVTVGDCLNTWEIARNSFRVFGFSKAPLQRENALVRNASTAPYLTRHVSPTNLMQPYLLIQCFDTKQQIVLQSSE